MTQKPASSARHFLARRLRLLRAENGWTQETLAALAGLNRNQIGDIERARRNVRLETTERLARAFGLTVRELFET